jgi:hypothetical protein
MTAIRNKLTIYFSVLVGCIFHQNLVKLVKSTIESFYRACLAGFWLLQKRLRLWLLWWSGFSGGVESFLKTFGKIAPRVDF